LEDRARERHAFAPRGLESSQHVHEPTRVVLNRLHRIEIRTLVISNISGVMTEHVKRFTAQEPQKPLISKTNSLGELHLAGQSPQTLCPQLAVVAERPLHRAGHFMSRRGKTGRKVIPGE